MNKRGGVLGIVFWFVIGFFTGIFLSTILS